MDGNMLISHVADDSISLDSLSFSGLVAIQDQQPKLPPPNQTKGYQVSKHDPEFEFTSTKTNLNFAVNPIKTTPADRLISNGQLQPQALAFQTKQSLITNPPGYPNSLITTHSSSKMSSRKTGSAMKYHEKLNKASKHTNKESTVTRTGFGQKMKSFLSPCRECRTIKPGAVKAQTVPGENLKIY
ncbi:uncharacterized protein LOC113872601 [Abrus precatorius]|uniref:Uncharacterized protein LOC113872601 n=1 Tax=Abrus precatorius TaxID=3816 RepID=A0A8B8ME53_ABRPR|nr:uncharacterized protein LOC113872601 [Abrus precatorius]